MKIVLVGTRRTSPPIIATARCRGAVSQLYILRYKYQHQFVFPILHLQFFFKFTVYCLNPLIAYFSSAFDGILKYYNTLILHLLLLFFLTKLLHKITRM